MQVISLFRTCALVSICLFGLACNNNNDNPAVTGKPGTDDKPLFSFGVVADVQYADRENNGTRHFKLSPGKLKEAVGTFNDKKVDFVVSLGDFINDDLRSYDSLLAITGKLKMPIWHTLGNHDFAANPEKKDHLLGLLQMKHTYYSFVRNGWRLIFLDGNDISLFANEKNSDKYETAEKFLKNLEAENAANAYDWNGAISNEQMDWLANELSLSQKNKEQVIIFCHFPIYPDNVPELLWNAGSIRTLIEKYPNVFAYFNGHNHVSRFIRNSGINYVSFRGMVEMKENSFAIISVYRDFIGITGYGEEVSRKLQDASEKTMLK